MKYFFASLLIASSLSSNNSKIQWQNFDTISKKKVSWFEAENYCSKLTNSNSKNWRMPNINELFTILLKTEGSNKKKFDLTRLPSNHTYWTSNVNVYNKKYAWKINIYNTFLISTKKSGMYSVICVKDKK